MKQRVVSLSVLQTGKFMAVSYGLFSLILVPFILISVIANPKSLGMLIMLLLYPIMGFIGGVIMAAIYNVVAKWIGGLEVTIESMDEGFPENQNPGVGPSMY